MGSQWSQKANRLSSRPRREAPQTGSSQAADRIPACWPETAKGSTRAAEAYIDSRHRSDRRPDPDAQSSLLRAGQS